VGETNGVPGCGSGQSLASASKSLVQGLARRGLLCFEVGENVIRLVAHHGTPLERIPEALDILTEAVAELVGDKTAATSKTRSPATTYAC